MKRAERVNVAFGSTPELNCIAKTDVQAAANLPIAELRTSKSRPKSLVEPMATNVFQYANTKRRGLACSILLPDSLCLLQCPALYIREFLLVFGHRCGARFS